MAEMATETQTETVDNGSTEETSDNGTNAGTTEDTTPETGGNGTTDTASTQEQRLPDTHPLVKAYASSQAELKQLRAAGQQSKDQAATELQTAQSELTSTKESLTAVQGKYDRLEAFLTAVGGPLSRALDSKSFTTALFESDTDVAELVTKWHQDNPSATSSALSSGSGTAAPKGQSLNELLRAAAK